MRYVYFPTTAVVFLLCVMEDGKSNEIAQVGNGAIGVASLMSGETSFSRAVVSSAGYAYRVNAQALQREFNRAGVLMHLLLLHPGADHADGADRGLQPASLGGSATLPLVAAQP